MEMDVAGKFTMEEIFFIKISNSDKKEGAIRILKECAHYVAPDISKVIHGTIDKLDAICDEEYAKIRNL